jgi:urease accessory protein
MSYAASPQATNSDPLLLCRRLPVSEPVAGALRLALGAEERTGLRGLRHSSCGRALLLQLPRGEALVPGELLAPAEGEQLVQVEAAPEALLRVRDHRPLALLQAAYHLGNRHVAMEIHTDELRLLRDSVLAQMLEHRGLEVEAIVAPFHPESGAYGHSHTYPPGSDKSASNHPASDQPATDGHTDHHHGDYQHAGHSHIGHSHSHSHSHVSPGNASDGQGSRSHSRDQHGDH